VKKCDHKIQCGGKFITGMGKIFNIDKKIVINPLRIFDEIIGIFNFHSTAE